MDMHLDKAMTKYMNTNMKPNMHVHFIFLGTNMNTKMNINMNINLVLVIYRYNNEYKSEILINDKPALKVLFRNMRTLRAWAVGAGR